MTNKAKKSDQSQSDEFKRIAREHGVELDEKTLAETLRRMAKREKGQTTDESERPTTDKSTPSDD